MQISMISYYLHYNMASMIKIKRDPKEIFIPNIFGQYKLNYQCEEPIYLSLLISKSYLNINQPKNKV